MRWLCAAVLLFVHLCAGAAATVVPGAADFHVLAYHDVRDDPQTMPDRYTVSTRTLAAHFEWLKTKGYRVVSVEDVVRSRSGGPPLPAKAVVLSFDDGYRSVYTHVFPLLKAYGYPAVVALVGSWLNSAEAEVREGKALERDDFVRWGEVREMVSSGLVEVASHSYDLHRGLVANPHGDAFPAALARRYDAQAGLYERDAEYEQRIRRDLELSSLLIARELGKRPRVIVWPYGRHSPATARAAHEVGLTVGLTLTPGANGSDTSLDSLHRELMIYDPSVDELAAALAPARAPPVRVMHIDLDYVYDPDPAQQRLNVGRLLDRVRAMGINTVFLQAYADPDGNGAAHAVYFPNRHIPVRADLFSHVAWQLHTRAGVNVYAWMPVLGYEAVGAFSSVERTVATKSDGSAAIPRVSAFSERGRALITELYEDLSSRAIFQGILFHDDATLTDFEDASPGALRYYAETWELPPDIAAIRADKALLADWTRRKSQHLTAFTQTLAAAVRTHQQHVPTARNIYARVVLQPESREWFAQDYSEFLAAYDFTAIMAMPFMEGETEAVPWLRRLVAEASRTQDALKRTIFELQARDWRTERWLPSELMAEKMQALQRAGALNFGYYPDDLYDDHPRIETIKPFFSLETFPYQDVKRP